MCQWKMYKIWIETLEKRIKHIIYVFSILQNCYLPKDIYFHKLFLFGYKQFQNVCLRLILFYLLNYFDIFVCVIYLSNGLLYDLYRLFNLWIIMNIAENKLMKAYQLLPSNQVIATIYNFFIIIILLEICNI